jgi:hypothetical protein
VEVTVRRGGLVAGDEASFKKSRDTDVSQRVEWSP